MNVSVVLAASSLTVHGPSAVQFWASVFSITAGALLVTTYLNRLRRAAFRVYHDDIRKTVRSENQITRAEIQAEVALQLAPVLAEFSPNHGASMKDQLKEMVTTVNEIQREVKDNTARLDALSGGT